MKYGELKLVILNLKLSLHHTATTIITFVISPSHLSTTRAKILHQTPRTRYHCRIYTTTTIKTYRSVVIGSCEGEKTNWITPVCDSLWVDSYITSYSLSLFFFWYSVSGIDTRETINFIIKTSLVLLFGLCDRVEVETMSISSRPWLCCVCLSFGSWLCYVSILIVVIRFLLRFEWRVW